MPAAHRQSPCRTLARPLARGLYLVTPDAADVQSLRARVAPLLPYAACLQYRNKSADAALRAVQGMALRELCNEHGVPLIINDDVELAASVTADGVHLGETDAAIADARARLGDAAIIGVSCYDALPRAVDAVAAGADYVAFGALFTSPTKPHTRRAAPQLLGDAAILGVPRVAIGGITPENAGAVIAAGADLIAMISGVFDAADPVAAARACRALFD